MDSIIITAVGFLVAAIALMTPLFKLNATITNLTTEVRLLREDSKDMKTKNSKDHTQFYERIEDLENFKTEVNTTMRIYHKQ